MTKAESGFQPANLTSRILDNEGLMNHFVYNYVYIRGYR